MACNIMTDTADLFPVTCDLNYINENQNLVFQGSLVLQRTRDPWNTRREIQIQTKLDQLS
jgi:hypothetical protein